MKRILLTLLLTFMLLSACNQAAAKTIVNSTDDLLRSSGDDIMRVVSRSEDDVLRQTSPYYDDVTRYWDDVLRQSSQPVDQIPAPLIYRTSRLYPEQEYLLGQLQEKLGLGLDQAALYLQGVCSVVSWTAWFEKYPSASTTESYVRYVAQKNNVKIVDFVDYVESIRKFSIAMLEDERFDSRAAGARIIFDALCLVAG